MGLAILIWTIGLCTIIFLAIKMKEHNDIAGMVATLGIFFTIMGSISFILPSDYPDYKIAPYYTYVDERNIYFNDYSLADKYLFVPNHYYRKIGFINEWAYCGSPIAIEIPEGYNLKIGDNTPEPEPHIVSGGCE